MNSKWRSRIGVCDGTDAVVGGFADPEVRQYVVASEGLDEAIYGNTLARPHMNPTAARISGRNNVQCVMDAVEKGTILDNASQNDILQRTGAEILEESMKKYVPAAKWKDGAPQYGAAPLRNMFENFLAAENSSELICSLEKASGIQKLVEEAYVVSGKREAMIA